MPKRANERKTSLHLLKGDVEEDLDSHTADLVSDASDYRSCVF
ncbi:hypothetical protein PT276_06860 [Orbaceae bacterium ESL0721]|nr:hypothetical protein [Orbaceae bacterium ESL0721]